MSSSRQNWSPETYLRNASFVPELGRDVMSLLAPVAGERILDLGCGEGMLSAEITAAGANVYAIDASASQVEVARARGVDAHVLDALDLGFDAEFDAVFSNAALHWMRPISKVFDLVFRALKPGGRFVAELGGAGNISSIRTALYDVLESRGIDAARHDPWSFPGPGEATGLLKKSGFEVSQLHMFRRPTALPGDVGGWLDTFASQFLAEVDPADHDAVIAEVRALLELQLVGDDGVWVADYVRLKFMAVKP